MIYRCMELLPLLALGGFATCFGISDWKKREVDLRLVLLAYCGAILTNVSVVLSGRIAEIEPAASLSIIFLSGILFAFWKLGLLAFGDVVAIPAMLLMLLTSSALAILLYFVSALVFVAVLSIVKNLHNNLKYRSNMYGSLQQKLHLMLFCYYGNGEAEKHAFKYNDTDGSRRDYDDEEFYNGKEKTWLVPGLPLLCGFLPAMMVLVIIFFFF